MLCVPEQRFPCSPREDHGEQAVPCSLLEDYCEDLHPAGCGGLHTGADGCALEELQPVEGPFWSRLVAATAAHRGAGFLAGSAARGGLRLEQCILEELDFVERICPGKTEEEVAEAVLTTDCNSQSAALPGREEGEEWGMKE